MLHPFVDTLYPGIWFYSVPSEADLNLHIQQEVVAFPQFSEHGKSVEITLTNGVSSTEGIICGSFPVGQYFTLPSWTCSLKSSGWPLVLFLTFCPSSFFLPSQQSLSVSSSWLLPGTCLSQPATKRLYPPLPLQSSLVHHPFSLTTSTISSLFIHTFDYPSAALLFFLLPINMPILCLYLLSQHWALYYLHYFSFSHLNICSVFTM